MKNVLKMICAGVAITSLCVTFVACNNETNSESGQGEDDAGMKIGEATGNVIGKFADHGFGCFLVQVDEEFPIGETFEHVDRPGDFTTLPKDGTYYNVIQVQHKLPIAIGDKISFSYREYRTEDFDPLFIRGDGTTTADHTEPQVPTYVITDYQIINK